MTPQTDVALAPLSTIAVGGAARFFVEARSASDVCDALAWADARALPMYVLGGGSNVVIADEGLDGVVMRIAIRGVEAWRREGTEVRSVGAGEPWDDFVDRTVGEGLAGLECLSGIPGYAGGTPVQNVGAYGQDVSGTIVRVSAVDRRTRTPVTFSNAECGFGYRASRFKQADANRFVVTHVEYALAAGAPPTLTYADVAAVFAGRGGNAPSLCEVREAILQIRRGKGMVVEPGNPASRSCGSFFVNPVVSRELFARVQSVAAAAVPHYSVDAARVKLPAAWLIEHAGFARGTTRGPVGISPFQAQAIVNLGSARAADVVELACAVKQAVLDAFGVSLVPEPVFLGFPSSGRLTWLLGPQRSL